MIYYEDFEVDEDEPFLDKAVARRSDPLDVLSDCGLKEAVIQSIELLPERERLLMSLYYEHNMNLKEIGATLDVSESRACQLHAQAIVRMRTRLRDGRWINQGPARKGVNRPPEKTSTRPLAL